MDQTLDDAMVIIQEASTAIERVSSKLDGLQNNNREVVAALKDLTNKVAQLESRQNEPCQERKQTCIKVPLYIRVSTLVCMYPCFIRFIILFYIVLQNLVRAVYKDFIDTASHQFVLTERYSIMYYAYVHIQLHMINTVSDFLFSFSGVHNQEVSSSIAREVKIRHPSAKEEEIQGI